MINQAGDLLYRVGLLLLANARRRGSFPVDANELSRDLMEIRTKFDGVLILVRENKPNWDAVADFVVEARPRSADRLELKCRHEKTVISADLHLDGVLINQSLGFGLGFADLDEGINHLRPAQHELPPTFRGTEFVCALAAEPQPGAAVKILVAELYATGIVVHYQYDDSADFVSSPPSVSLTDDIGTAYKWAGTEIAGLHVRRGSERFTPAVPDGARELRVATCAGDISIKLAAI